MKHILLSGFMLFGLGVAADARDTQVYDMTVSVYNIPDNMSDLSDHDIFKEAYRSLPSDRYDIQDDITTINTDYPDMMITHGKRIYQKTLENVKQNSKYHIIKDENEHIAIFNPSISHKIANLDKLNNRQIERIKRMEEIPDTGVTMIVNHISSDENNIHVDFEIHATNFDDNPVTHKKNKNDDDSEENTDDDNDEKQKTINDDKCKDNKKNQDNDDDDKKCKKNIPNVILDEVIKKYNVDIQYGETMVYITDFGRIPHKLYQEDKTNKDSGTEEKKPTRYMVFIKPSVE